MAVQQVLKLVIARFWPKRNLHLHLVFMADLLGSDFRRLHRTQQGTGNNRIHFDLKPGQRRPYVVRLLDAQLVQGALLVFSGAHRRIAGAGVAQEVNDHAFIPPGVLVTAPLPSPFSARSRR